MTYCKRPRRRGVGFCAAATVALVLTACAVGQEPPPVVSTQPASQPSTGIRNWNKPKWNDNRNAGRGRGACPAAPTPRQTANASIANPRATARSSGVVMNDGAAGGCHQRWPKRRRGNRHSEAARYRASNAIRFLSSTIFFTTSDTAWLMTLALVSWDPAHTVRISLWAW